MIQSYLLDTNHAGELLKASGKVQFPPSIDEKNVLLSLCYPGIGELWFMVYNSRMVSQNAAQLRRFLTQYIIFEFDARAAEEYGAIQTEVLKRGHQIKPLDIQIAAIARANNLVVLTGDKHFSYIPGIKHANWLA